MTLSMHLASRLISEMKCGGYGFCHTELESPIVNVGGQDGHVCCKVILYALQFLSASRITRSFAYPYLFARVAGKA